MVDACSRMTSSQEQLARRARAQKLIEELEKDGTVAGWFKVLLFCKANDVSEWECTGKGQKDAMYTFFGRELTPTDHENEYRLDLGKRFEIEMYLTHDKQWRAAFVFDSRAVTDAYAENPETALERLQGSARGFQQVVAGLF